MQFDSPPENCSYLGGDKPGEYYCRFVTENLVSDAKTMIAAGEGCCSSLNSDRKKVVHGINCLCDRCEKIRQFLRDGV